MNIVTIGSDTLDPTRCELVEIYTILRYVECLSNYYKLDGGLIKLGCDCERGLKRNLLWKKCRAKLR